MEGRDVNWCTRERENREVLLVHHPTIPLVF